MSITGLEAYGDQIDQTCKLIDIDSTVVKAIMQVESGFNTWAFRYEPNFKYSNKPEYFAQLNQITVETEKVLQACSAGLGQVMGATARDLGFKGPIVSLCEPSVGIYWCALYVKRLWLKYPDCNAYISAYNAGSPSTKNQDYVAKVLSFTKK